MITFTTIDIDLPSKVDFNKIRNWLVGLINEEGKTLGEINYVFCNDSYLHKINLEFLQHDTLTDIITFPTTNDSEIISSDLFISVDRIMENSELLKLDLNSEFLRVIVHGILHLLEYDDKTEKQILLMREKENTYISKFKNI